MAEITQQQLEDASRDADDFALIVNGAADLSNPGHADGTVSTRTGGDVRTIKRAIQDAEEEIASADIGDGAAALINQRLDRLPPPAWVPYILFDDGVRRTPNVVLNFARGEAWNGHAVVPIGDLWTGDNLQGVSKSAVITAMGDTSGGLHYAIDYKTPDFHTDANAPVADDLMFSLGALGNGGGLNHRVQKIAASGTLAPGGGFTGLVDIGGSGYQVGTKTVGTFRGQGIHRDSVTIDAGFGVRSLYDAGYRYQQAFYGGGSWATINQFATMPNAFGIGKRIGFNDGSPLSNVEVRQIILFNRPLSHTEIARLGEFNEARVDPIYFVSDSYDNNNTVRESVLMVLNKTLGYVPSASDNEGGRGLNWMLGKITAAIAAEPKFAHHRLVLTDGGLDRSSLRYPSSDGVTEPASGLWSDWDMLDYLRRIRALFTNPNWSLCSPGQGQAPDLSGPDRAAFYKLLARYQATYPDAWIDWNPLLRSRAIAIAGTYATASDAYEAYTVNGGQPPHLMPDKVHMNWWDAGDVGTGRAAGPGGFLSFGQGVGGHLLATGYARQPL